MTLVNSGTINANQSAGMTIQVNGGVTNTGIIEGTGGALALSSTTVTNTGGTISANANTLVADQFNDQRWHCDPYRSCDFAA